MNNEFKLILVAGARPNFMKIAPLMHALENHGFIKPILVHTGQHYDEKMSDRFFRELNIPQPAINLEVGSGSHAQQTARIMEAFEKTCLDVKPDMVLVVGDVNSTLACTLVASKLQIKTVHYEAGLRSLDRSMPEEINRLVTDAISDYYLTTSIDANENLHREGVSKDSIHFVGNLMIDTLVKNLPNFDSRTLQFSLLNKPGKEIRQEVDFKKGQYGVMTFHRPANVDDLATLTQLVAIWSEVAKRYPLIFPIHPRTYKNLKDFGLLDALNASAHLFLIEPLGYFEFLALVKDAAFVLTDSGGIQEETTYLNIPCLTLRTSTERPVTIWEGSNKLINVQDILEEIQLISEGKGKKGNQPKFWDGHAATRIVAVIEAIAASKPVAFV